MALKERNEADCSIRELSKSNNQTRLPVYSEATTQVSVYLRSMLKYSSESPKLSHVVRGARCSAGRIVATQSYDFRACNDPQTMKNNDFKLGNFACKFSEFTPVILLEVWYWKQNK